MAPIKKNVCLCTCHDQHVSITLHTSVVRKTVCQLLSLEVTDKYVTTWISTGNFTHTNVKKWSVTNFWRRERQRTRMCACVCVLSVLDFLLAFPYSDDLITNSVHCASSWCNSLGYVHSVTVLVLFLPIDFLFYSDNFAQCLKHLQMRVF